MCPSLPRDDKRKEGGGGVGFGLGWVKYLTYERVTALASTGCLALLADDKGVLVFRFTVSRLYSRHLFHLADGWMVSLAEEREREREREHWMYE